MSFYGDPGKEWVKLGIGKSSAFASLFYHLNQDHTSNQFKQLFPFFKDYQRFIWIDGKKYKFKDYSEQEILETVKRFNMETDVALIDDAHKFLSTSNGRRFLYRLQTNVKFVILVSS